MQLVLSVENAPAASELSLRWYWLTQDMTQLHSEGLGSLDDLAASLRQHGESARLQALLLLPGDKVSARRLHYSDSEKKHLAKILPYQLEDALIDDIDALHFALSTPKAGNVTLSYTNKEWITSIFSQLHSLGIDVARCVSAPALLPQIDLAVDQPSANDAANTSDVAATPEDVVAAAAAIPDRAIWSLGADATCVWIKPNAQDAFSVEWRNAAGALQLALATQAREKHIEFSLFAETDAALGQLRELLSPQQQADIVNSDLRPRWQLDYQAPAINLCQGELALRLPLDRWWKLWRPSVILLAVGLVVYVASALVSINQLKQQSQSIARQLEAEARKVIPDGRLVNIQRQVAALVPAQGGTGQAQVVNTLGVVLPAAARHPSVEIKALVYVSETGELIVNLQANNFAVFDELAESIRASGYTAEISSANAQGDVQTARLTVKH